MIIHQTAVGELAVFCYILECEQTRQAVVIDPGGEEERLLALIVDRHLDLRFIINTHVHPDHTCGNDFLRRHTGAAVVLHRDDVALLADPQANLFLRRMGLPTPPADRLVEDGDILSFGACSLTVLHTPGHTPGGICLYGSGNLFTGDSLFVGAAGRVDLPGGDFNTLINSLATKIATLPDETVIWPGHDYGDTPTSTVGREKKENPFLGGEW